MTGADDVVFLSMSTIRFSTTISEHLSSEFGSESRDRYWEIFEALLVELGCADYLGALQRYPARHYAMVDDKLRILTVMK
jgi:hypothetical protein